jgi:hypothetical protein
MEPFKDDSKGSLVDLSSASSEADEMERKESITLDDRKIDINDQEMTRVESANDLTEAEDASPRVVEHHTIGTRVF